jgi:hypothetical protein
VHVANCRAWASAMASWLSSTHVLKYLQLPGQDEERVGLGRGCCPTAHLVIGCTDGCTSMVRPAMSCCICPWLCVQSKESACW